MFSSDTLALTLSLPQMLRQVVRPREVVFAVRTSPVYLLITHLISPNWVCCPGVPDYVLVASLGFHTAVVLALHGTAMVLHVLACPFVSLFRPWVVMGLERT